MGDLRLKELGLDDGSLLIEKVAQVGVDRLSQAYLIFGLTGIPINKVIDTGDLFECYRQRNKMELVSAQVEALEFLYELLRKTFRPEPQPEQRVVEACAAYSHLKELVFDTESDTVAVLFVNKHGALIRQQILFMGEKFTFENFDCKDIFIKALESNATGFYIAYRKAKKKFYDVSKADYDFKNKISDNAELLGVKLIDLMAFDDAGYQII